MAMTQREFKKRWESDTNGGGITLEDIADCAKAWRLYPTPKVNPLDEVIDAVLKKAQITKYPDQISDEGKRRRNARSKERRRKTPGETPVNVPPQ